MPVTIEAIVFDAYGTLYDVQSVTAATERAFPGHGELIAQIWRIKQLEYSWLRSLMHRYEDFSTVTRDALVYSLKTLGLTYDDATLESILQKYVYLDLYPDALPALQSLKGYKIAILSNGSTDMLTSLVRNTGLDSILDATISVDAKRVFKPSPDAYALIEEYLHVKPNRVLFVSSNPWDALGAKSAGFSVAWIARVPSKAMAETFARTDMVAPLAMFQALRTQMDELGLRVDYTVSGLATLLQIVSDRPPG
jgi:2-haloacid dehalogenase